MKLLLTSDGLTSKKIKRTFLKLLEKSPEKSKVLIIYSERGSYKKYLNIIQRQLSSIGIKRKNLIFLNISRKTRKVSDFEVIYFCGGNTFYLLKRVRENKLEDLIKNHIKRNKLYIGVSAGSIIVHKTIKIAGWGSEGDINEVRLKNLRGLGLTKIAIFPHFKKKLDREVNAFRKKVDYPVREIRDRQAILILGNKIQKL
jgi:dipeptidase E